MYEFAAVPKAFPAAMLAVALAGCKSVQLDADIGLASLSLEGDVALVPASSPGTTKTGLSNDLEDDLGFDDAERGAYVRLQLRHERSTVMVSSLWYEQTAVGMLSQDFGGLMAGESVTTRTELIDLKTALHYDVWRSGALRVSPGFGLGFLDVRMRAESASGVEELDSLVLMPMAYLRTELDFGAVRALVDAGGFYSDFLGFDGWMADVDAMLRWNPLPAVELYGGYRAIWLDGDGDSHGQDYSLDMLLHGWVLGFKLPF